MNTTVFRDLVMLMVLGFVAMVVWMLPHLNPPAVDDNTEPPGNVIVHATWGEGDTDVDLWVTGPGEPRPVGYSNKGGVLWNLLRDDLGSFPDTTDLNYENAYTRGILPGEYIINVHCFRCSVLPVVVAVELSINRGEDGKGGVEIIAGTKLELHSWGEEVTAMRVELTRDGRLVPGSMNHIFRPLRAYKTERPG